MDAGAVIRHIVLTRFKPEVSEADIAALHAGLSAVIANHPGARGFHGGRSESPEQMERGYTHAFTIDFDDWAALARYADDPDHKSLGAKLIGMAHGGRDGLLVLDIDSAG